MIPYELTKIKAFAFDIDGVLSPSTIPMSEEGTPLRMVNIKDGYAIQLAVKLGYEIAIITGGNARANEVRYNSLGVKDIFQSAGVKIDVLKSWMESKGLKQDEVLYMGDDIPDLQCMRYVSLSCAPFDAAWEAKQTALYTSKFSGGYGCVRDVIEQVLKANGQWLADDKAFGW